MNGGAERVVTGLTVNDFNGATGLPKFDELLQTLAHYLEWLVPGQSKAIVGELAHFLEHRDVIGWVLLVTMLFFSTLAFTPGHVIAQPTR